MATDDLGVAGADPGANARGTSTTVLPEESEDVESVFLSDAAHPDFSTSRLGPGRSEANSILSFVCALRRRKKNAATEKAARTIIHAMTMPAMAPAGRPELSPWLTVAVGELVSLTPCAGTVPVEGAAV
jgi:hypothetical protein